MMKIVREIWENRKGYKSKRKGQPISKAILNVSRKHIVAEVQEKGNQRKGGFYRWERMAEDKH